MRLVCESNFITSLTVSPTLDLIYLLYPYCSMECKFPNKRSLIGRKKKPKNWEREGYICKRGHVERAGFGKRLGINSINAKRKNSVRMNLSVYHNTEYTSHSGVFIQKSWSWVKKKILCKIIIIILIFFNFNMYYKTYWTF